MVFRRPAVALVKPMPCSIHHARDFSFPVIARNQWPTRSAFFSAVGPVNARIRFVLFDIFGLSDFAC